MLARRLRQRQSPGCGTVTIESQNGGNGGNGGNGTNGGGNGGLNGFTQQQVMIAVVVLAVVGVAVASG